MRLLRSTLFWLHLAAGLVCGAVILVMSFTGAVLAFEGEIVAWAERDLRRVEPPAAGAAASLPLDELVAKARATAAAATPDLFPRVTGVVVSADPRDAVAVNFGRELGTYYVDQYTGAVRVPGATRTHDFMHVMEDWHRRLAATGDHRDTGRALTGVSNAAFLFLALSGLWLWWPRKWSLRALRPSLWFAGAKDKARDWNWHNVYGFWFLPVIVVLTATGMVISYRWASDLAYRVVGEAPPAAGQGPAAAPAQEFKIERPEGAKKLTYAEALARIQSASPGWTEITLREGLPQRRGPGAGSANASTAPGQGLAAGTGQNAQANSTPSASGEGRRSGPRDGSGRGAGRAPQPYSATVKADDGSPRFAATQLVLDPFTGETLSRNGYADQSTGRKVRTWLRYLHTGQALGRVGQLVAGLACVAGCVLVYTGFALSFRRFFRRRAEARSAGS